MRWLVPILLLAALILWGKGLSATDSPKVSPAEPSPNATAASSSFDYDDWASTLERFVDDDGRVDYAGLRADRGSLDRFVEQIRGVSPRSHPDRFDTDADSLAFYINAYNALVFVGVLDLDPDADTVWGTTGTGLKFFGLNKYIIGGEKLSLKKLEDDWIRADFGEPRVHAALNCASSGCPRLPREPFLPATLDEQLDAAMAEFVDRTVVASADGTSVSMSKIFDWFRGDFLDWETSQGRPDATLIDYVNRFRDESKQLPADAKVTFPDYDKRLNRQE